MDERAREGIYRVSDTENIKENVGSAAALNSQERVDLLIKELRKRTAELEEANRELRRVSHYRSLFLARMSHELRTPLTSILGFSEILLDQEELTDAQRRFCQKVQDSGFQLQASLNQLVDLSRIEAGQTEVFLQEFSLRETVRESCSGAARVVRRAPLWECVASQARLPWYTMTVSPMVAIVAVRGGNSTHGKS